MHSSSLTAALALLLTTANGAIVLGLSSDGGTYAWLQSAGACNAQYLDPICNTDFEVPSGGATFQLIGCNNQTPNVPQYNTRNGNRDANCTPANDDGNCYTVDSGILVSSYTAYTVC